MARMSISGLPGVALGSVAIPAGCWWGVTLGVRGATGHAPLSDSRMERPLAEQRVEVGFPKTYPWHVFSMTGALSSSVLPRTGSVPASIQPVLGRGGLGIWKGAQPFSPGPPRAAGERVSCLGTGAEEEEQCQWQGAWWQQSQPKEELCVLRGLRDPIVSPCEDNSSLWLDRVWLQWLPGLRVLIPRAPEGVKRGEENRRKKTEV